MYSLLMIRNFVEMH